MKLALGMRDLTPDNLAFAKMIGATHIVAVSPDCASNVGPWFDYEKLVQLKSQIEAAGLEIGAIQNIPPAWYHEIIYNGPGRDEQVANYCRTVANVGRAGIPILHWNFHAVKVWRTSRHTPGRGGATFTSYDHDLMANAPMAGPRPIGEEELWENFEVLAKAIIPVAEENGLKMALHPDDPPVSPISGAACLFRSVEAFQRVIDLVPSPANGLLFCQGCWAELLGVEEGTFNVYDAIRHFGEQGKIHYVHFRNIVGRMPHFREAFIDAGDIEMLRAMRVYHEVGFDGPMIPDHMPHMPGDGDYAQRARAHAIGYMKALKQCVEA